MPVGAYLPLHVHPCWLLPCELSGGQLKGPVGNKGGRDVTACCSQPALLSICEPGVLSELQGTCGGGR